MPALSYRGAPRRGGSGYDIVDYARNPPTLVGPPIRSEATQARYITHMFDVFAAEGLHSASVYTFIAPDLPFSPSPLHDLDTASFAIVETLRRRPADPASPLHLAAEAGLRRGRGGGQGRGLGGTSETPVRDWRAPGQAGQGRREAE